MLLRALSFLFTSSALATATCGPPEPPSLTGSGVRWTEADALFHQDPKWLGGDLAATIDLGDDRTLWLFGDSFVATSPANVRGEARLVRNSVAVMTGLDPLTATMQHGWRGGVTAADPPESFFPEDGARWFWPADGVRLPGGPLLIFLNRLRAAPGDSLGFAADGFSAVLVRDPAGPPRTWQLEPAATSAAPYAPTASVGCSAVADGHLVSLMIDGAAHRGRLARWPLAQIATGALAAPQWWTSSGWRAQAELTSPPEIVLDEGSTECSLHRHPSGAWVHVSSRGFGATPIALRTAPALEGPWSDAEDLFTPPESLVPDAFVYAGKAHPTLTSPDGALVITYADNSFTFADLFDPRRAATLYWPHFATLTLRPR
jgi:hypothetical protein